MMLSWLSFGVFLALSIGALSQQKDPLKDFCRKFGHQTAIIDNKLYIDGGIVNWNPIQDNPLNYTNRYFMYSDFNVIENGMPQQYSNLSKSSEVPVVQGGMLWADPVNKWLHLYGGEYIEGSPDSLALWSFDVLNNKWNSKSVNNLQISRVSYGAGATDEANGKGYYYGGWLSNASVPAFGTRMPTTNLIIYDMVKDVWTNNTGPDSIPRAEGVLNYIPASDGGMLVYFGGLQFPGGPGNYTPVGVRPLMKTLKVAIVWLTIPQMPMSEIKLYDIANAKWYTQTATGDVPDARRRFCAGSTWAKDRSSYNVYLYGGASMPPNTVGFDDVYILSIPSFTWIKWYPEAPGTSYPHHSLSCNVYRGSQMIVMGGTFPNSSDCDAAIVYGQHNLNLGKENPESKKWYQYLENVTDYRVPDEIAAKIGGGAEGGATKKAPDSWGNNDLPTYFARAYTAAVRTPTRSIPSTATPTVTQTDTEKKPPTGTIAGAAVGGGVFLLICAAAAAYFYCIRRKKDKNTSSRPSELENTEHNTYVSNEQLENKPPNRNDTQTPMAELPPNATHVYPYPPPKQDIYFNPSSPGPDSTRTYSYAQTSPGSPGYDAGYAHSVPSAPHSPPIPGPYYFDGRQNLNPPDQAQPPPQASYGHSPAHLPQQGQGQWPAENNAVYATQPYYPRPPSEMPTVRSPPNQGYQDVDGIFVAPVISAEHSARGSPTAVSPHDSRTVSYERINSGFGYEGSSGERVVSGLQNERSYSGGQQERSYSGSNLATPVSRAYGQPSPVSSEYVGDERMRQNVRGRQHSYEYRHPGA
ncbi:hypothetical protein K469DRAFT_684242 [Zopfia rhizophila CBS 207.26]|uniref:Galactose oxidase n=1 Tax=Zopfia rhizophila CBS 207.26 TaxID=1314779 RepID=A0A6A6ED43_9PEZI|nr:hypothetical protein K469DRAFT_684242 [Zopfia rhizophila CBS 207.26]